MLSGIENVEGSAFSDTMIGDANANVLSGLAGSDTLRGGGGADVMDGGASTDAISYSDATSAISAAFTAAGSGSGTLGDAAGDTFTNAEVRQGSAYGETLGGYSTGQSLRGGTGDDTYVLKGVSASTIVENASEGIDEVQTTLASVTLTENVENLTYTGAGDFIGTGNASGNVITSGDGNDILSGLGGADSLMGGDGVDTASYAFSAAGVTANLSTGFGSGADAAGDTYSGIENLLGSAFDDVLTGDVGDNIVIGNGGADLISGDSGADVIELWRGQAFGGDDDDTLFALGDGYELHGEDGADELHLGGVTGSGDGGEGSDVYFFEAAGNVFIADTGTSGSDVLHFQLDVADVGSRYDAATDTLWVGEADDVALTDPANAVALTGYGDPMNPTYHSIERFYANGVEFFLI